MRNLSTTFLNAVRSGATTLAFCWKLTLRDGRVMGFTSHDQQLVIDGVSYKPQNGIVPSAFEQNLSLDADDVELKATFDDSQISEEDLVSGKLTAADYLYFLVDWTNLPSSLSATPRQYLELSAGRLGETTSTENEFTVQALSLFDQLDQKQTIQTSPVCRATLGDDNCKVNLGPFTHDLTVVSSPNRYTIITTGLSKPDGYFRNGQIEFRSGQNDGVIAKIADWDNTAKRITLFVPVFYPIANGDDIRCIAGCRKTLRACQQDFDNIRNFRGEPSLPGQDVWTSGSPVSGADPNQDF